MEESKRSSTTGTPDDSSSEAPKENTSMPDLPDSKQEENRLDIHGTICGGKYLEEAHSSGALSDLGPLKEVDIDMPLSLTELVTSHGKEFLVVRFVTGDEDNPFNWPAGKKAFITALLCCMTLFIGLATTAYSSGISKMTKDLHTSTEMGQLGLFLFNQTCAIAPLFLAPFCELVGRKLVYTGGFLGFCLCFIGLALGKNIGTILVMRTLLGLFGCIGTILVGGTFSDMYLPPNRSIPMATFAYIAILGTLAAPIYAGFIDEKLGWRWIEGIQGIGNTPLLAVIILFFPETRGGVCLQKRAKLLRNATGDKRYRAAMDMEVPNVKEMLHESSVKAVHMLVTEPVVFMFGLWIAFAWFVTFLFLSVIPITFETKHGWNEGVAGLPYISLCIGVTLAFGCNFLQIRKYDNLRAALGGANVPPEARLYGAMWGAAFLPIGLFIYSFTQYGFVTWAAPAIALAPIAFGIFFIFESTYSYTADCYGENSSSAIAGQGLLRNTLGAVGPLFATAFFKNVGSQYAGLILAIAGTVLTFIPFVFFRIGPKLRARSKLAEVY